MAERLVVVCDVHDTNVLATGHVRLDIAGEVHELDLCDEHLGQLRESLGTLLASTQSDSRSCPRCSSHRSSSWTSPAISSRT